jgi:hypothetical protein
MKEKKQCLRHLIVTEMPYELLKLLIEEKALSAFVRNLIKDIEVDSLIRPNYNKLRRIASLMASFPRNIILMAFVWRKTDEGHDFWSDIYKKAQLI